MSAPHRQIVDALVALVVDAIPDAAGWRTHLEEPVWHDPNGRHLAIWFVGDQVNEHENTTGDIDVTDLYAVRYWESAPEKARVVVDEAAAKDVENVMDEVRTVVMTNLGNVGTSYATLYRGSRKFVGVDPVSKGQVRGFEMSVTARRRIPH